MLLTMATMMAPLAPKGMHLNEVIHAHEDVGTLFCAATEKNTQAGGGLIICMFQPLT